MNKTPAERNTRTKEAVEQILKAYASPVSLNDLYAFIKMSLPKTAFSTIYRITQKLEAEGKLRRIDWRERGSRYEWAELPHHHHIVCQLCGAVTDISDDLLRYDEAKLIEATGYRVTHHSIELEGVCPDCLKKSPV